MILKGYDPRQFSMPRFFADDLDHVLIPNGMNKVKIMVSSDPLCPKCYFQSLTE